LVEDAHSNAFIRLPPATPQTEGSELDKSEVNAVTIAPESIKQQPPATPLNEGSALVSLPLLGVALMLPPIGSVSGNSIIGGVEDFELS
jgi:hypothetical protein